MLCASTWKLSQTLERQSGIIIKTQALELDCITSKLDSYPQSVVLLQAKYLNKSVFQFPHLYIGDDNTHFTRSEGSRELLYVKHMDQILTLYPHICFSSFGGSALTVSSSLLWIQVQEELLIFQSIQLVFIVQTVSCLPSSLHIKLETRGIIKALLLYLNNRLLYPYAYISMHTQAYTHTSDLNVISALVFKNPLVSGH